MALIQKTNPVGLDNEVQRFQTWIYNELIALGWTNYESYPLVYKTESENGIRPELNIDWKDYSEVLYSDKFNATSFFIQDDTTDYNKTNTVNISIIFQADVKELYSNVPHYADNEMQEEITDIIRRNDYGFTLNTIQRGIGNVYSEFDKEGIKYSDIAPRHTLRYNFTVTYGSSCY